MQDEVLGADTAAETDASQSGYDHNALFEITERQVGKTNQAILAQPLKLFIVYQIYLHVFMSDLNVMHQGGLAVDNSS